MSAMARRVPYLFDAHHARVQRKHKKASRRAQLAVAPRRKSTISKQEYDMYVIAVPVLLGLPELMPHQIMLQHSLLTKVTSEVIGRIIFISHEWTGFEHPDPSREQLKALQGVISRLMEGKEDNVQSEWKQQLGFKENVRVRASEWSAALPHMFVWVDFCCMPQPNAGPMPCTSNVQLAETFDERVLSRAIDTAEKALRSMRQERKGTGGDSSDHRHDASNTLAIALSEAVRSIPSYVERTTLMIVLVPDIKHTDRESRICEYRTWRGRGWCRMEFMCAWLARNEIHVMVTHGGNSTPYFLIPADALLLPPGQGEFSCCARNHDFGQGPGTAPCDKQKVREVLDMMIEAKVSHLAGTNQMFRARYFASLKHWFLRGLDAMSSDQAAALGINEPEMLGSSSRLLERFKARMRWRENGEAEEKRHTGASLLFWAACANEVEVVQQLCTCTKNARLHKRSELNRGLVRAWPRETLLRGINPMLMACCFAGWEVVNTLLDAGADPGARSQGGFGAMHCMAVFGRSRNIRAWVRRFPDWSLEHREKITGGTPLIHGAVFGPDKIATLEALVEAGADPCTVTDSGVFLLSAIANNADADADLVRSALRFDPQLNVDQQCRPRTLKWRMIYWGCRLAYNVGSRSGVVVHMASGTNATALHLGASIRNLAVVRVLVEELQADKTKRNVQGSTPSRVAALVCGTSNSGIPVELARMLRASEA